MDEMVHVLSHPLLQHKLSILRREDTGVKDFRQVVSEIATLMCYEATRDLPTEEVEIQTPVAKAKVQVLAGKKMARWATLASTGTPRPTSRWSITARCPTTSASGTLLSWIPCWPPAALPPPPSSS